MTDEMNLGWKVYSNDRHFYGTVALDILFAHNEVAILRRMGVMCATPIPVELSKLLNWTRRNRK